MELQGPSRKYKLFAENNGSINFKKQRVLEGMSVFVEGRKGRRNGRKPGREKEIKERKEERTINPACVAQCLSVHLRTRRSWFHF